MSWERKVIAVTGANGLLGSHLVRFFQSRGATVHALVRKSATTAFQPPNRKVFRCDLPGSIDESGLVGVDALIHCAYMTRFTTLTEAIKVNQEGSNRLYQLSKKLEIKQFVFISSTSAHEDAASYYGRSKFALESEFSHPDDLVIRPGLIVSSEGGLFHRMVKTVTRLPVLPIFNGGRQIVQTVHIDDLTAIIAAALGRQLTGILTVAEQESTTMKGLLLAIADQLRLKRLTASVPLWPVLKLLQLCERIGMRLPVTSENLLGLTSLRFCPPSPELKSLGMPIRAWRDSIRGVNA